MKNIETAKNLFTWNTKNLIAEAQLDKSELSRFFASEFQVIANGRKYEANYDNYLEFLNRFRSTIKTINYDFYESIVNEDHVVMPLTATIIRVSGDKEIFEAILILKFNNEHKITLWHEVYVQV